MEMAMAPVMDHRVRPNTAQNVFKMTGFITLPTHLLRLPQPNHNGQDDEPNS